MNINQQFQHNLNLILTQGFKKEDRTGVGTISFPGIMLRHDMSDGFPLLTLRKIPFKSAAVELEGFIKGITSKKWYKERGCGYWDFWHSNIHKNFLNISDKQYSLEDDDLGPLGYSHGLRNFGGDYASLPTIHTPFDKNIRIEKSEDPFVGQKFNGKYGDFIVEKIVVKGSGSSRNKSRIYPRYQIFFLKTGYRGDYRKDAIKRDKVKDPYFPNFFGVGCSGNYDKNISNVEKIKEAWSRMLRRCYDKSHDSYPYYGKRGISVENKWLIFEYFLQDFIKLKGYSQYYSKPSLERIDVNGNYSKDNCEIIDFSQQSKNKTNTYKYDVYKDEKIIFSQLNSEELQKSICIPYHSIPRYANKKKYKDYEIRGQQNTKTILKKGFDQLLYIVDTLKKNPSSRRMVVSAWDIKNLNKMALPPCHFAWQVNVTDGKLNLFYTMRSVDFILGNNLNSYGLLLHLLAKEAGLKEGILTGFFSDAHVYLNQLEGACELLKRDINIPLPKIKTEKFTSIFDWEYKDTELLDYNPQAPIKFEVAV